jgi:hypothetical protein
MATGAATSQVVEMSRLIVCPLEDISSPIFSRLIDEGGRCKSRQHLRIGTPFGSCNDLDQRIGAELSDFNGKGDISNESFSTEVSEAYLSTASASLPASEHPAIVRVYEYTS